MAKKSVLSQHLSRLGRKGGKATGKKRTPEERSAIASKAAVARWTKWREKRTLCTECGYKIPPAESRRIDFDHVRCPKCGIAFIPGGKPKGYWSCEHPGGCACGCGHVPGACEYCDYIAEKAGV